MKLLKHILRMHPAALVLISFLLAIIIGTLLLKLPIALCAGHISWINAFFTATSAVCVTGLTVVDTGSYFTMFGQCVLLILIQIGGLGVMTFSVFLFRWLGKSIPFRHRMVMQDVFSHTPRRDILSLVKSTIFFTLFVEAVGALILAIYWYHELPFWSAAFYGLFHSVSAFCNAGFSLFPDNLMKFSNSIVVNFVICGLIISGGIGFPVIYDIQSWLIERKRKHRVKLSVQTKSVLVTTFYLILGGALLFFFLEQDLVLKTESLLHRMLISVFQSVTCRTAGFNSIDIGSLKESTLSIMVLLMFIGASPGSCGGGIKTTTLALLSVFAWSRLRGNDHVNMYKKSIPTETVNRGVTLIILSVCVIVFVLFMILVGESFTVNNISGHSRSFLACLFETVSAFGTVGLSMGITPDLGLWGKGWISIMMIIGRVGILTFSYILTSRDSLNNIEYSEENLMIG
jgi:trk system potassium uptake protein